MIAEETKSFNTAPTTKSMNRRILLSKRSLLSSTIIEPKNILIISYRLNHSIYCSIYCSSIRRVLHLNHDDKERYRSSCYYDGCIIICHSLLLLFYNLISFNLFPLLFKRFQSYKDKINKSKTDYNQKRTLRYFNYYVVIFLFIWNQQHQVRQQHRYDVKNLSSSLLFVGAAKPFDNIIPYIDNSRVRKNNAILSNRNMITLRNAGGSSSFQRPCYRNNDNVKMTTMILPSLQHEVGTKFIIVSSTTKTTTASPRTGRFLLYFREWLMPLSPVLLTMKKSTIMSTTTSSSTSEHLFNQRGGGWISHHQPQQKKQSLLRHPQYQQLFQYKLFRKTRIHSNKNNRYNDIIYIIKTGIAGGIAGAVGTTLLYPFDSAKTLRQASPKQFKSVIAALQYMLLYQQDQYYHHIALTRIRFPFRLLSYNYGRVYKGLFTSVIGSIPSSALYFGAYETSKTYIRRLLLENNNNPNLNNNNKHHDQHHDDTSFYQRLIIHGCSAACGNILSSGIFVPKELIKQKMQYIGGTASVVTTSLFRKTIQSIIKEKGILGLYCGYKAVLIRNIPTAAMRFCLYEELRRTILLLHQNKQQQQFDTINKKSRSSSLLISSSSTSSIVSFQLFIAGAIAGAIASGVMTPVDVIKTRLSTGALCSIERGGILGCIQLIIEDTGWKSLYAGAGSRIFFSAAFSGFGFGTFELAKRLLHVNNNNDQHQQEDDE